MGLIWTYLIKNKLDSLARPQIPPNSKGKAIENYEKFLDLWKYAGSGIAEAKDAKERLAALE